MMFKIRGTIGSSYPSAYDDVLALKESLLKLGGFEPLAGQLNGFADTRMFEAVKRFQKHHGLRSDGVVVPNGKTEEEIQKQLRSQTRAVRPFKSERYSQLGLTSSKLRQQLYGVWRNLGNMLLLGEGNLSFSRALLQLSGTGLSAMTATTYENHTNLSEEATQNAMWLSNRGVRVIHNVDAARLDKNFDGETFDTITFQFPNVGSRTPKYGQNANHILIRRFLRNAVRHLAPYGRIIISVVDSSYYEGVFKMEAAAEFAGVSICGKGPFDPRRFPGYVHVNTKNDNSAAESYDSFKTFTLCHSSAQCDVQCA